MSLQNDDSLLNDLLSEGAAPAVESTSLDTLLSTVRRTRRQRRLVRACSLLGVVGLISLCYIPLLHRSGNEFQQQGETSVAVSDRIPSPPSTPSAPKFKTLTDEELFALFPDRQIAIVGPPGNQRLLFLDPPRR